MNEISQGLTISVLGLIITFSALGVFILVMIVLQKMFPYKAEPAEEAPAPEEAIAPTLADDNDEALVAAAIAVAILAARKTSGSPALGAALTEGRGGWWAGNRTTAHESRDLVKS